MKLLAFDTATEWCTAAVWQDGDCAFRAVHAGQRHSDLLVPLCRELLDAAGWRLSDLDGLAYGMGPGSFTGLRIACGVAQGLALGAGLPVLGISTLEALAEEAASLHATDRVAACLDARMNEVYVSLLERDGAGWRSLVGPRVCAPEAAPLPEGPGYVGAGSGFAAYPALRALFQARLDRVDDTLIPHARAIATLAAPRFGRGEGLPAEAAEPLYVRDKVALKISER